MDTSRMKPGSPSFGTASISPSPHDVVVDDVDNSEEKQDFWARKDTENTFLPKSLVARKVTLAVVGLLISPVVSLLLFGVLGALISVMVLVAALPATIYAIVRYIREGDRAISWKEQTGVLLMWFAPLFVLPAIFYSLFISVTCFSKNMKGIMEGEDISNINLVFGWIEKSMPSVLQFDEEPRKERTIEESDPLLGRNSHEA